MLRVLHFRIRQRHNAMAQPPFIQIDMSHKPGASTGCTVSELSIVSELKDWKDSIQVTCVKFLLIRSTSEM